MNLINTANKKQYEIKRISYQSSNGIVYCGPASDPQRGDCFIKVIHYGKEHDSVLRRALRRDAVDEATTLRTLTGISSVHGKVPALYDYWDDIQSQRYVIVMQQMPGVTLRHWMQKRPAEKLTQKDLFVRSQIVYQLCRVLQEINQYKSGLFHRDLKPENIHIRLDEKHRWTVSILDFGCTKLIRAHNVGTATYQAPEQTTAAGSRALNTFKTDIFSLGQILYELLTGNVPVIGIDYLKEGNRKVWLKTPELPPEVLALPSGSLLNDLLQQMTRYDMEERPTYKKIIGQLCEVKYNFGRKQK